MKEITCTVKELFDAIEEKNNTKVEYNVFFTQKDNIQIKDENNNFVKINALIKKQDSIVELSTKSTVIKVGSKHKICLDKMSGKCIFAKDLMVTNKIDTQLGLEEIISVKNIEKIHDVYDFEINSKSHLYSTSDGLIHHNTGKSELVQKLAKFFDVKVMRINFNIGTTEQHMIGKFVVKDGHTQFIYGIIPLAMRHGWWVLLDEIDYAQPEHLSALQAVLEGNSLMIAQNENEEIHPHENFRIFATGNTKGRGDESQSYTGTNFLNMAFLDRWSVFELDYTKEEAKICSEYIQDPILVDQLMQYFKLLRKAADPKEGELGNVSFSTRRIIQICEVLSLGESLKDAMTYELWSRYDEHEVHVMEELAYDVWEREHYFKGWKLGMEHAPEPKIIQQP